MKALSVISMFMFTSLIVLGQTFKTDEFSQSGECMIDTIAQSELSKQQLFSNALNYIAKSFKNSNNVIQSKDLELGEIIVKGNMKAPFRNVIATKKSKGYRYDTIDGNLRVHFNMNIYVRDNRFKVVISSIKYELISELKIPLYCSTTLDMEEETAARNAMVDLIMDTSVGLNSKPLNDF